MSKLERQSVYRPGASFFEEGGVTYFQFQADAGSVIGPRKARKADKVDHAIEWRIFNEGRLPQLDHDHNGVAGGSAPAVEAQEQAVEAAKAPAPAKRRGRPPKKA